MRGAGRGHGSDLHSICPPSRHQRGKRCPEAVTTARRAQRWGRACVTELPGLPLLPDKPCVSAGPPPSQGRLPGAISGVRFPSPLPSLNCLSTPPPQLFLRITIIRPSGGTRNCVTGTDNRTRWPGFSQEPALRTPDPGSSRGATSTREGGAGQRPAGATPGPTRRPMGTTRPLQPALPCTVTTRGTALTRPRGSPATKEARTRPRARAAPGWRAVSVPLGRPGHGVAGLGPPGPELLSVSSTSRVQPLCP